MEYFSILVPPPFSMSHYAIFAPNSNLQLNVISYLTAIFLQGCAGEA